LIGSKRIPFAFNSCHDITPTLNALWCLCKSKWSLYCALLAWIRLFYDFNMQIINSMCKRLNWLRHPSIKRHEKKVYKLSKFVTIDNFKWTHAYRFIHRRQRENQIPTSIMITYQTSQKVVQACLTILVGPFV
jgi:hypothetical protein